ncbi:MAG: Maf family protein [Coriobacteriia bacterium]|nr:Maf family protein [Coriobacteriia bacterium]
MNVEDGSGAISASKNPPTGHDAQLLLASASPRRRRLLAMLGAPYEITSVDTPEDLDSPLKGVPPVLARSIAAEKALAARVEADENTTVLAFDTIVVADRRILGKPADLDDAFAMLRLLSGRTHDVITGVAFQLPGMLEPRTFAVTTPVLMRELSEDDMRAWADKGELLGCAGAYNIESHLASVEADQCFHNVTGMPLCHLYRALVRDGYSGLTSPVAACDAARCTTCELGPLVTRHAPAIPAPR